MVFFFGISLKVFDAKCGDSLRFMTVDICQNIRFIQNSIDQILIHKSKSTKPLSFFRSDHTHLTCVKINLLNAAFIVPVRRNQPCRIIVIVRSNKIRIFDSLFQNLVRIFLNVNLIKILRKQKEKFIAAVYIG